jgi:hypothetical protein
LVSHHDDFAPSDTAPVGEDFHGFRGASLQLQHRAGRQFQHLTYRELDSTDFDTDSQANVEQEVRGLSEGRIGEGVTGRRGGVLGWLRDRRRAP